ncbi:MAG TPA: carboxymuconolactone decarboxylase family protein [Nocardioidaceae bacterium]|nr:carboxymuconolactone decarboxylase family protein [Nocardioidaceae bacterium]
MASSFRIQKARMSGVSGRVLAAYARRTYGEVPDTAYVLWHHRPALKAVMALERKVARFGALDPHLKSFAVMAAAARIGCSWCLDFGYYLAHDEGLDLTKVREVPRWRESDAFTDLERDVMAYAEAMTATPPEVTDEMVTGLTDRLGTEAVVELTLMVALENERSRLNSAMGLASQGFSDVCELPLARPVAESVS